MGNLNWQATTPQNLRHPSGNAGGSGGPTKAVGRAPLAVKKTAAPAMDALAKAKAALSAGRITRQQFDAVVAKQSTNAGSEGGV